LLGAQQPAPTLNQNNALEVVAPPDRRVGAHRRGAHPSLVIEAVRAKTAAPHVRSPERVAAWCAAVIHATDASVGNSSRRSLFDTPSAPR
jgi:hypothetical protein